MGKKLYQNGELIQVTITFDPYMQELTKPYVDRKTILDEWAKNFQTDIYRKSGSNSILWREITWYGLIHYHGVIKVDSPRKLASAIAKYKYQKVGKQHVNIDLDSSDSGDIQTWIDYCKKDSKEMGDPLAMASDDIFDGYAING